MLTRLELHDLGRRIDAVMTTAGQLSLKAAHPTFREQATLIEIDALDTKFRLRGCTLGDDPLAHTLVERELTRLERRCADLLAWLSANGLDAEPAPN